MKRKDEDDGSNIGKRKVVVDIGEHRKTWIDNVARVSGSKISDVFRALIDQAITEDPENYVGKMNKYKLKAEIDELEREEKALQDRKKQLIARVEGRAANHERAVAN